MNHFSNNARLFVTPAAVAFATTVYYPTGATLGNRDAAPTPAVNTIAETVTTNAALSVFAHSTTANTKPKTCNIRSIRVVVAGGANATVVVESLGGTDITPVYAATAAGVLADWGEGVRFEGGFRVTVTATAGVNPQVEILYDLIP